MSPSRLAAGIEPVTQAVTQQVDRYHHEEYRQPRRQYHVRGHQHIAGAIPYHTAPGGLRRLHPETKEREARLGDDHGGHAKGRLHDQG